MNNACRYCLLCPVCSLQMFGFLDFWGDIFTLSWSGGPTYVLLWFNRYIETQGERVFHKLLVSATWKYLAILRLLCCYMSDFSEAKLLPNYITSFFQWPQKTDMVFADFTDVYRLPLKIRSCIQEYVSVLLFHCTVLCYSCSEGRPMGFWKDAALLGNLLLLGNLSLL